MTTAQKIKQGYYDSQKRFTQIDGDKFGACLKQVFKPNEDTVLEWRIRKEDDTLCIIEFNEGGKGYHIYELNK